MTRCYLLYSLLDRPRPRSSLRRRSLCEDRPLHSCGWGLYGLVYGGVNATLKDADSYDAIHC